MKIPRMTSWSFSRWQCYTTCPRQCYFKHVKGLKEPSRPESERGTLIHEDAARFLEGYTSELTMPETITWERSLHRLRDEGATAERKFPFGEGWVPLHPDTWKEPHVWLRCQLDACYTEQDGTLVVIDYKSGKRRDWHRSQLELYGLAYALSPDYTAHFGPLKLRLEDWYMDEPDKPESRAVSEVIFLGDEFLDVEKMAWGRNIQAMMCDTIFAPRPSRLCPYCFFSRSKGGPCDY